MARRKRRVQPISFDVIQELQLVVSPYDVRQGMFSGGGINAITKQRHQPGPRLRLLCRQGPESRGRRDRQRPIATFNDKQFGGTLGGPILRNTGVLPRQRRVGHEEHAVRVLCLRDIRRRVRHTRPRLQQHPQHRHDPIRLSIPAALTSSSATPTTTRSSSRTDFNLGQQPADGPPQLRRRRPTMSARRSTSPTSSRATSTARTARPIRRSGS